MKALAITAVLVVMPFLAGCLEVPADPIVAPPPRDTAKADTCKPMPYCVDPQPPAPINSRED